MTVSDVAEREEHVYFRCPIPSNQAKATIRVGRRRVAATVQEASIDAFTVLVASRYASKLKVGRPWVLVYDGTSTEVHPEWMFNAPDGKVQMGLRRLRDLTTPGNPRGSVLIRIGGARYEDPSYSAAAYGGFVLFLFCLLALPGLGDHLGTAPRIQAAFQWFVRGIEQLLA